MKDVIKYGLPIPLIVISIIVYFVWNPPKCKCNTCTDKVCTICTCTKDKNCGDANCRVKRSRRVQK